MAPQYHRDVGTVIQIFRNFIRGRSWNEQLRHPENLSPRPYPPLQMPTGPQKTSANHYFTRDGRRMVAPPLVVADNITKHLTSGESQPKTGSKSVPKPGDTYNWD